MHTALFDLDGTLVDSRDDLVRAVNLARRDFALPPRPAGEIVACIGDGVRALIERAVPERPELWDALVARQREHYQRHLLDQTRPYPGVVEALERLAAAGWRLGVVTNKPGVFARRILAGLGLDRYLGAVVGGEDAPTLKPDPGPLHAAAALLGGVLDAGDWMVGDHATDLEAGARAGVRCCFCRYGFGEARGLAYDLAVDRLDVFSVTLVTKTFGGLGN